MSPLCAQAMMRMMQTQQLYLAHFGGSEKPGAAGARSLAPSRSAGGAVALNMRPAVAGLPALACVPKAAARPAPSPFLPAETQFVNALIKKKEAALAAARPSVQGLFK